MTDAKHISGGEPLPQDLIESEEFHELPVGGENTPLVVIDLKLRQRDVLAVLMSGAGVEKAAQTAGVGRATVYRWMKKDEPFKAALRGWQEQAIASARGRLVAASDRAVKVVLDRLDKGDMQAAMTVLRSGGVLVAGPSPIQEQKPSATGAASRNIRLTPALEMRMREMLLSLAAPECQEVTPETKLLPADQSVSASEHGERIPAVDAASMSK